MAIGKKTIKRLAAAFVVLSVGSLALLFIVNRWIRSHSPQEILEKIPEGVTMAVGRIRQTATRDGVAEWLLEAESGRYDPDGRKAELTDLSVTYYLEDREEVQLEAVDGTLNTETNAMAVSGDVRVRYSGYLMTADHLDYDHSVRRLTTTSGVRIAGNGMDLTAQSMTVDLNAETATFKGEVKGTLNGELLNR
jgi:LPS export ABC transporter protein LptC